MQYPDDDNGKMLQAMAESGIDLTKSLDVDFFLVFEDKRDAESALEDLVAREEEGELEINFNEELEKWELIVTLNMVPEYEAIVAREVELNEFASEYDGMTDGWGVMQHQEGDAEFADDDHECGDHCHH
ncbi:ribonuclease E inhibitor RraB [Shewanella submarina]|uniref:Ribonuclease E inhibitor RraB n=1 Tax=Shewanella submarina TaxID=2016376 RepID=A0ABV7G905_9GAMM|nr:ribonuclease E inhibitor RraB [Shewanella submarina]MCL1036641.1 ribonuclease E inhibitor RraB [Shewanella submarina]